MDQYNQRQRGVSVLPAFNHLQSDLVPIDTAVDRPHPMSQFILNSASRLEKCLVVNVDHQLLVFSARGRMDTKAVAGPSHSIEAIQRPLRARGPQIARRRWRGPSKFLVIEMMSAGQSQEQIAPSQLATWRLDNDLRLKRNVVSDDNVVRWARINRRRF